jgi:hypothetical protein
MLDKMETGRGHLGGSVEHLEGKGRESAVAIPGFLCGIPRLCRLRTEGLVPVSKYRTYRSHASVYGPNKPNSWLPTDAWLCPHYFISLPPWIGMDPQIGQSACCGLCWEPFFLGAVALLHSVGDCAKGCHVCGLPAGSIRGAYVDWRGRLMCHVDRVFTYRVYIDSNGCDCQI